MPFPKDGDGRYYWSLDGIHFQRLPAGYEGEVMMAKIQTAAAIVQLVQTMVPVTDLSGDRTQEFYDVGPFADEDLAALGITSAQLTACVVLLEQAGKLMAGEAVTPAIYRSTLNAVRRVAT